MDIREYLNEVGLYQVDALDDEILRVFGAKEGIRYIKEADALFTEWEQRIEHSDGTDPYILRQGTLRDFFCQNEQMARIMASYSDRICFRKFLRRIQTHREHFGRDILDIGCGNGIITCYIAALLPHAHVTGMDLSPVVLQRAAELKERLGIKNLTLCEADALNRSSNRFDTVVSIRTFHENTGIPPMNKPNPSYDLACEDYASCLASLLRPEGILFSIERFHSKEGYERILAALAHHGILTGTASAAGTDRNGVYPVTEDFFCREGDHVTSFRLLVSVCSLA